MNPEVKTKWVEALRSGRYKQGKEVLKRDVDYADESRYCCLGVLCEIAVESGIDIVVASPEDAERNDGAWEFDADHEGVTSPVQEWSGLHGSLGDFRDEAGCPTLLSHNGKNYASVAEMNDSGYSFAEIADIIEKEF